MHDLKSFKGEGKFCERLAYKIQEKINISIDSMDLFLIK